MPTPRCWRGSRPCAARPGCAWAWAASRTACCPSRCWSRQGRRPAASSRATSPPGRGHRSHAVTGAVGVAAALLLPGTVAADARPPASAGTHRVQVLHPAGRTHVDVQLALVDGHCTLVQAALVRTARKILEGTLFVAQSAMEPGCPGPWPADDHMKGDSKCPQP